MPSTISIHDYRPPISSWHSLNGLRCLLWPSSRITRGPTYVDFSECAEGVTARNCYILLSEFQFPWPPFLPIIWMMEKQIPNPSKYIPPKRKKTAVYTPTMQTKNGHDPSYIDLDNQHKVTLVLNCLTPLPEHFSDPKDRWVMHVFTLCFRAEN